MSTGSSTRIKISLKSTHLRKNLFRKRFKQIRKNTFQCKHRSRFYILIIEFNLNIVISALILQNFMLIFFNHFLIIMEKHNLFEE